MTPWTEARQAPLSIGFPRQDYWLLLSGLPFPSPRDLPNPGFEPTSPALAGRFFTTEPPETPRVVLRLAPNGEEVVGAACDLELADSVLMVVMGRKPRSHHSQDIILPW